MVTIFASGPRFDSPHSKKIQHKIIKVAKINLFGWWAENGQWLENVKRSIDLGDSFLKIDRNLNVWALKILNLKILAGSSAVVNKLVFNPIKIKSIGLGD